jgi:uncharacterized protein (TIGR02757 family)
MGPLKPARRSQALVDILEGCYRQYHQRAYVHPDPLTFLYAWDQVKDREIVGLVAASLAYGRVAQILKSVSAVLEKIGPSPHRYVTRSTRKAMQDRFAGFRHRFADGDQMAALLYGAGRVIRQFGSLENGFADGLAPDGKNLQAALGHLYRQLIRGRSHPGHLLPDPGKTSACKRLHLYLRWMVRRDDVDPGGWHCVVPSELIVPLDTHMHTVGRRLGFTRRRQADLRTALEVTAGFRKICPEDPVRYDFSLTRLGIHPNLDITLLPRYQ